MAGLDTDRTRGWDFWRIIWLMPAVFAPHIAEEYYGGFPDWVTRVMGASFNNLAFALNNLAFMLILLALTFWASRTRSRMAAFLLIASLAEFEGTMLFVSHDRHFLAALSNRVLEVTPEGVHQYAGGYTEYVARTGHEAPGLHPGH